MSEATLKRRVAVLENQLERLKGVLDSSWVIVSHDGDADHPRPKVRRVYWIGWEPPANAINGDRWEIPK